MHYAQLRQLELLKQAMTQPGYNPAKPKINGSSTFYHITGKEMSRLARKLVCLFKTNEVSVSIGDNDHKEAYEHFRMVFEIMTGQDPSAVSEKEYKALKPKKMFINIVEGIDSTSLYVTLLNDENVDARWVFAHTRITEPLSYYAVDLHGFFGLVQGLVKAAELRKEVSIYPQFLCAKDWIVGKPFPTKSKTQVPSRVKLQAIGILRSVINALLVITTGDGADEVAHPSIAMFLAVESAALQAFDYTFFMYNVSFCNKDVVVSIDANTSKTTVAVVGSGEVQFTPFSEKHKITVVNAIANVMKDGSPVSIEKAYLTKEDVKVLEQETITKGFNKLATALEAVLPSQNDTEPRLDVFVIKNNRGIEILSAVSCEFIYTNAN